MIVDTNILIDYLRDKDEAIEFIDASNNLFAVSVISITELFAGIRNEREITDIQDLLGTMEILSLDEEIAERAGHILKKYSKSHNIGIADSLIAATSIIHNEPLATLNVKDFPMLENVFKPY